MYRILAAGLLIFGLSVVVISTPAAADEDRVEIEVEVTNPDGDGIGDAAVDIDWADGSISDETNVGGRLVDDVPDEANLTIAVSHEDYVVNTDTTITEFEGGLVEITMHPPVDFTISVSDETDPVTDANVTIQKGDQDWIGHARTDGDGEVHFDHIEAGDYDMTVNKAGYYEASDTVSVTDNQTEDVELESAEEAVSITVIDWVVDEPVSEATVEALVAGDLERSASVDGDGSTSILLKVNTDYELRADAPEYESTTADLSMGESEASVELTINRTPALSLEPTNERVVAGEDLHVTVTDEYDDPVEDATVEVGDESATTDDDGVARITVSAGTHELTASHDGLEAGPITIEGVEDESAIPDPDEQPGFAGPAVLLGILVSLGVLVRRH